MKTRFPFWGRVAALMLAVGLSLSAGAGPSKLVSGINPGEPPPAGGGGDSSMPIISLDGRYVLFASTANNLTLTSNSNPLPALIPPKLNVFLRDRASNTTVLVSVNLARSGGGNGDSLPSGLSDDGRYALFESAGSDLVKGDTNGATDVFVRDLLSETTSLVSVGTNGSLAN